MQEQGHVTQARGACGCPGGWDAMERNFTQSTQNPRCPTDRLSIALMLLGLTVFGIFAPSHRPAHGAELSEAQKEYLKKLDRPVLLRGDYFKAITIAYKDFSKRLERDEFKSKILDGEEATSFQWLSRIENYDIHIEQTDTQFIVYFSPTVRGDAPIIMGGVIEYEIDCKTFQFTSKSTGK
jgi:hypothetical protein